MLITIALLATGLLAIGYLRASIEESRPGFVLNANIVLKNWIAENKWMSYFTPFFTVFLFVIILLSWIVYGLVSIAEFLAFLLKKLWAGILWVWYEVFHPTIFCIFKLIWHYVFVTSFKFFMNSLTVIPESIRFGNLLVSFKKLILPVFLTTTLVIIYILTLNIIVQVISSLIIFYLFQYTVFVSLSSFRPATFSKSMVMTGLRMSVIWLGFASVSAALMVLLKQYSHVYVISSLSITLLQILLPVLVVFAIAFALSTLYLPAYMAEVKSDFSIIGFWKNTLIRMPKLIASQPFQFIGLGVISIIPLFFVVLLNFTVERVSGSDLITHATNSVLLDYHIPSVRNNDKEIERFTKLLSNVQISEDSISKDFDNRIASVREELKEAISLKDNIKDNKIHTFNRNAFTGEYQSFSYPDISGCRQIIWRIINTENNVIVKSQRMTGGTGTSVFYHQWKYPGKYSITLIRPNSCAVGVDPSIQVEVVAAVDSVEIPETRYFVTKEAAEYAIDLLNKQLIDVQKSKQNTISNIVKQKQIYSDSIEHISFKIQENWQMLVAKIVTIFGLAFLALIIASVLWTYFVTYHFDLYSFEMEGKHYVQNLFEQIKSNNSNQPYLGYFILLLMSLVVYLFTQVNELRDWLVRIIPF